jgi:hypothetical protein
MSRLELWAEGFIEDEDLTEDEVTELTSLVHAAVTKKILSRPGSHTFPEHSTLQ